VVETEHLYDMRRAADTIVRLIGCAPNKAMRYWEDLTQAIVRQLWLLAVEQHARSQVVVKREWRSQMRREWEQVRRRVWGKSRGSDDATSTCSRLVRFGWGAWL
jgi:hypothetical protein